MLFEEPATRLSGDKWGRGPKKGQMRARVSKFVLGTRHSLFYEFDHNKMGSLKIMH